MNVLYEELKPTEFRRRIAEAPIAYLPLGTLEWHGEHMPLGADGIQSKHFFMEMAESVGGIVLPMLFLGPDGSREADGITYYGMDRCGFTEPKMQYPDQQLDGSCYWISDDRFFQLLDAVAMQISRAGFKIWVAHGHGPSSVLFMEKAEIWKEKYGLTCLNLFGTFEENAEDKGFQVDHGGVNETSIVMAYRGDLVDLELLPGDLEVWPKAIGMGDPRLYANAELGQGAIAFTRNRIAKELAALIDGFS